MPKQSNYRSHSTNKQPLTALEVKRIEYYISEGIALKIIGKMFGRAYKTIWIIRNDMRRKREA